MAADGYFHYSEVVLSDVGVSPALNVNLSSVIFSSVLSGTSGHPGAEYKLTLQDNEMTITAGTFTLTNDMKTGSYYYYVVAEDVNGDKSTDYASAPVQITIPASV